MKNERPKSSKGGLRSSMQNKMTSNQVLHQRSNANIKPQNLGMKGVDRVIESAKEESKSASLSKMHPQQQQPPFTSNSNVRQGKKVDNSMS